MSASDIASLFKKFGGSPAQYQEITQAETEKASQKRWPSMFGGKKAAAQSDVPADEPEQQPAAEPEVAPAAPVAEQPAPAAPAPAAAPEPKPAPAPTPSKKPSAKTPDAWSSAGLQSLLAKLADEANKPATPEPEQPKEPEPVAAAQPVRSKPELSEIKVVAVVSGKGGVGKSTMAANIAAALQKVGRPVLAIDLDPQNALHHHFQPEGEVSEEQGVVCFQQDWREQAVPTKDGVFVLPYGLADEAQRRIFEAQLADDPLWLAYQLSDLQLSEGAVVVIDTPPGPSIYLQQALTVANVALVVSLADAASYTALPMIDRLIASYTDERDDFAGTAYVVNQVDQSRQLNKDITQVMQGLLGERLIGRITRDQSISEALAYNRNVMDYDPHGRGCRDILDCTMALVGYFASDDEGA